MVAEGAMDVAVNRRRFDVDEYYRMAEAGILAPGDRVELIDGEIVQKVTPQKSAHAAAILRAAEALRVLFPLGHTIRTQLPLAVSRYSEPEPDVAVVEGTVSDYDDAHPVSAVLVVEVADTTLRFDRTVKSSLYASAGVGEYWIVNLHDRAVECHRDAVPMTNEPFGSGYRSITRHEEGSLLTPAAAPGRQVAVADLFPRRRTT